MSNVICLISVSVVTLLGAWLIRFGWNLGH